MLLQADPTLKFANKNFNVKRILNNDKEIDSPYNTYKYKGLPPGPICLVTQQAIDATLNFNNHDFIFFVLNLNLMACLIIHLITNNIKSLPMPTIRH